MPHHSTRAPGVKAHVDAKPRLRQSDIAEPMRFEEEANTTPTLAKIGLVLIAIAFAGMWFVG